MNENQFEIELIQYLTGGRITDSKRSDASDDLRMREKSDNYIID